MGRTAVFGAADPGSSPGPRALLRFSFDAEMENDKILDFNYSFFGVK